MQLKHHLIVITLIILSVFSVWQVMIEPPPAPVTPPTSVTTVKAKVIDIVRASWGMECNTLLDEITNTDTYISAYGGLIPDNPAEAREKLKENNVLDIVKAKCNGKVECEITNSIEYMETDLAPFCYEKLLEIEYRCFSFDKLRKTLVGPLLSRTIRCEQRQLPSEESL